MNIPVLPPTITAAPEVVELLGGPTAARALLADVQGPYRCVICGAETPFTTARPAAVVVIAYDDGDGPSVIGFAHPDCAVSGIYPVPHQAWPDGAGASAKQCLRLPGTDPQAVVILDMHPQRREVTPTGDTIDRTASDLLTTGFVLVTHPDQPLPAVPGLTATINRDRLAITDSTGESLFDGTLDLVPECISLVHATCRLGVIVAAGLRLDQPDHDHETDLVTAILNGRAVGATATLHTGR